MRKPTKKEINLALNSFSKKDRLIFFSFAAIFVICAVFIFKQINDKFLVEVPTQGGTLTEGVIGEAPRFINPLLATSDADRDLTELIYSGLLRVDDNGQYIPDLAESYDISKDGLIYTFTIKKNAVWQDGKPITADDVEFTIQKAKDPAIKSYKRPGFEGVQVIKIDDKTISFKLKQPYSPFLENTTLGILPKHIWKDVDAETFAYSKFNMEPIGSGPYMLSYISTKSSGSGTSGISLLPDYYDLKPFKYFTLGEPMIEKLRIRFYKNEEDLLVAYHSGDIDAMNTVPPITAQKLELQGIKITRNTLPRVFAIFFNQNHSKVLADKTVRRALDLVTSRSEVVQNVLLGYGTEISGPVPSIEYRNSTTTTSINLAAAKNLLTKGGWKFNTKKNLWEKIVKKQPTLTLAFDIATADTPELKSAAETIKKSWEELGAKINLRVYEIGDLNQNIIRPRKYDALFFGEIIGRNPDLFSFWHSSQRNDPGLNISMYANSKADKFLNLVRTEQDPVKKIKELSDLQKEIANDLPAIFVYSPEFLYTVPKNIKDIRIANISVPSDRFLYIYKWYIDTDKIWKIFAK